MNVIIRTGEEKFYHRVEQITREVFFYPERIKPGGIDSPYEHWIVHKLRIEDGIKELCLVAENDHQLIGHIICNNARIEISDKRIHVLNIGPISVLPQYQRQGVGKALIHSLIDKSRNMGYGAIMFFGRPEYYLKLGFIEAAKFGVTDCYGENYPAFMAMELIEGYLDNVQGGKYHESDIYDDAKMVSQ